MTPTWYTDKNNLLVTSYTILINLPTVTYAICDQAANWILIVYFVHHILILHNLWPLSNIHWLQILLRIFINDITFVTGQVLNSGWIIKAIDLR